MLAFVADHAVYHIALQTVDISSANHDLACINVTAAERLALPITDVTVNELYSLGICVQDRRNETSSSYALSDYTEPGIG